MSYRVKSHLCPQTLKLRMSINLQQILLVCVSSVVSDPLQPHWTIPRQASLSMGFSRQEYWSGLLFPAPGDLLYLAIEPSSLRSPALADGFFTTTATWEAHHLTVFQF